MCGSRERSVFCRYVLCSGDASCAAVFSLAFSSSCAAFVRRSRPLPFGPRARVFPGDQKRGEEDAYVIVRLMQDLSQDDCSYWYPERETGAGGAFKQDSLSYWLQFEGPGEAVVETVDAFQAC